MTQKFWTPERDQELKRHRAAGRSAGKIAELLHTTPSAVQARTARLSNLPPAAEIERRQRQKFLATEARKKAAAERRVREAAEARQRAQAVEDENSAAMHADLAAGVDRNTVMERAIRAGAKAATVAECLGLSRRRVVQIPGPATTPDETTPHETTPHEATRPEWTDEHIEFLKAMWPHHSAQEIADALGVTRGAVLGKVWRAEWRVGKPRKGATAEEAYRASASSETQADAAMRS